MSQPKALDTSGSEAFTDEKGNAWTMEELLADLDDGGYLYLTPKMCKDLAAHIRGAPSASGEREVWEQGVQDAHDYLCGCTFNASEKASIEGALALIRSLKGNHLWGPKGSARVGVPGYVRHRKGKARWHRGSLEGNPRYRTRSADDSAPACRERSAGLRRVHRTVFHCTATAGRMRRSALKGAYRK